MRCGVQVWDFVDSKKTGLIMVDSSRLNKDICVAFDLDGTIAKYDKWRGIECIGEPIRENVELLKRFLEKGVKVKIFTARVSPDNKFSKGSFRINPYWPSREISRKNVWNARDFVEDWVRIHIGRKLEITSDKDPSILWFFDDRSVHVDMNKPIDMDSLPDELKLVLS